MQQRLKAVFKCEGVCNLEPEMSMGYICSSSFFNGSSWSFFPFQVLICSRALRSNRVVLCSTVQHNVYKSLMQKRSSPERENNIEKKFSDSRFLPFCCLSEFLEGKKFLYFFLSLPEKVRWMEKKLDLKMKSSIFIFITYQYFCSN